MKWRRRLNATDVAVARTYLLAMAQHESSADPNRDLILACQLYGLGLGPMPDFAGAAREASLRRSGDETGDGPRPVGGD